MALSRRNMNCCRIALALALLLPACKKAEEAASPDDLPDLNKQIRPYVTVENTKLRSGPGPQFRGIADIPADAKIHVVGRDGEWALIVSKKGNAPGFIELAAIKPGESETEQPEFGEPRRVEGKYEAVADTQVRSGPGLHYPSLAEITKGTKLNVVDEEKGWLKVESRRGNKPGYVEASLAKPSDEK
ncbi:MAG TPA: SH3 domain-containing protein [Candidatus Binatia bacterium]